jgi:hypothetical protein
MTAIEVWLPLKSGRLGSRDCDHGPGSSVAMLWMRRAAIAERAAEGLNNRRDADLLVRYAEECYAEARRAHAEALYARDAHRHGVAAAP